MQVFIKDVYSVVSRIFQYSVSFVGFLFGNISYS